MRGPAGQGAGEHAACSDAFCGTDDGTMMPSARLHAPASCHADDADGPMTDGSNAAAQDPGPQHAPLRPAAGATQQHDDDDATEFTPQMWQLLQPVGGVGHAAGGGGGGGVVMADAMAPHAHAHGVVGPKVPQLPACPSAVLREPEGVNIVVQQLRASTMQLL